MLYSRLMVFSWAAKLDDGKSTIDLALLILKNIKKGKICLFVKASSKRVNNLFLRCS